MPEAKHKLHRPARKSCDASTCFDDYAQAEPETKKKILRSKPAPQNAGTVMVHS
jgi:hypothetical protein